MLAAYRLQAMVVVVIGVALAAYFLGREHGLSKYYDYKSAVEAEEAGRALETARTIETMVRATQWASDGWSAARADLARRPVVRVRDVCQEKVPAAPAVPAAPGQLDEAAAEPRPGSQGVFTPIEPPSSTEIVLTVEQCEARVTNAIQDAAQLIWLQDWVTQMRGSSK